VGNDPDGCDTSRMKLTLAGDAAAAGVPVRVTVTFWTRGAFAAAVNVTVTLWPGEKVAGENVAVTPAGSPEIEGVMS